ncbi:50S ribosomal protein L37 [Nitrososphaera sp. AFS]|uniref:50S ribosomal protein L37 n=1 Tax=Nitrososphaera sp. AFS TaxID=2301191 RepID=UPI0013923240|nr:50S ribosomal protein L37 [Nitrososphaera sp. AFS]NAL76955.1 50S ribosomal protein L37 [Nitrososphaera sp. AFS]
MVSRRKQGQRVLKGLGIKFGATVRKRYSKAYKTLKQKRRCPSCSSNKFTRIVSGIWFCRKCNYKVAGGAYDIDLEKLQSQSKNIVEIDAAK